ncbi:alpha-ribazole phosphatase [Clostridium peptidivorans]|uniref:alpha-ribazole phosphatase n=1 Tax=Clostridium peptidivorans TaxID=100174 RepID=UPI000BE23886|nr:alpha-ribazole phosphatase [Clostridium peptidivorans]
MNIYLLRHGQTEQNLKGFYYGNLDVDITSKGIKQIEYISNKVKNVTFDKIYVSNMKRALSSASIISRNKDISFIRDKRLNEMNLGVFEGKSYEDIQREYPKEFQKWSDDWKYYAPPEGESYVDFYERVKVFFQEILKLEDENVLLVTHGGVIRSILTYVMGEDLDVFWKFGSKNGDLTLVKYEYENLYIDSIIHADI